MVSSESENRFRAVGSKRMRLTRGKILVHIIIVLAVLALPLLLPPSCGPAVHSEAVLTAEISKLTHFGAALFTKP
jgi:hypothetical protein